MSISNKPPLSLAFRAAAVALLSPALHAQSSITVPAPAGPWTSFTAAGTDRLIFSFERDPTAANTSIPMAIPSAGATFSFKKDGVACPLANSTACSGSDVSAFSGFSGTIQVIDIGEAPPPSDFETTIVSAMGAWLVNPTTNASIEFVHAIPDVQVAYPAVVASGAVGVVLDATSSHSVYQPVAAAPAIMSFAFAQTVGPSVTLTISGALGEKATFVAPVVTASTDLEFTVTVNDGTLSATETITVSVEPPSKPVDAVLAVDTSGSMGWHRSGSANDLVGGCCSRLATAKFAAKYFVERLGALAADSRVGVAIFPGAPSPSSVLGKPHTPATGLATLANASSVDAIQADIGGESINACGDCTSIPASPGTPTGITVNWNGTPTRNGLDAAKTMLETVTPLGDRSRVILLLSDGAWNTSGDPAEAAYLSGFEIGGIQIPIYTVGMGSPGADDVNFVSLQDISVRTGLGTAADPIGFCAFNLGDATTGPNLIPHFEKVMSDMVSLDFAVDPSATIRRGEMARHKVWLGSLDAVASVTLSWESSAENLLDLQMVSPSGNTVQTQTSGNGYRNITLDQASLASSGGLGEWSLVVSYPVDDTGAAAAELTYNYGVLLASELKMETRVDRDRYTTGEEMRIEARLIERNRRLPGADVVVEVRRPDQGFGAWQAENQVTASQLGKVPESISGESLGLLARKNQALAGQGTSLPKMVAQPSVTLNDVGVDGDEHAGDGIYAGRFAGLDVPGLYQFSVRAEGVSTIGEHYTRESQFDRYVDIAMVPETLAEGIQFQDAVANPLFPDELLRLLEASPGEGFQRRFVVFRPEDPKGNLWGPGRAGKIRFLAQGAELEGPVADLLDGTYYQLIRFRTGTEPTVAIDVDGVVTPYVPVETNHDGFEWWWIPILLALFALVLMLVRRR